MEEGEEETIKENKKDLNIGNKNPLEELQVIYKLLLINTYNADSLEIETIKIYSKVEE